MIFAEDLPQVERRDLSVGQVAVRMGVMSGVSEEVFLGRVVLGLEGVDLRGAGFIGFSFCQIDGLG